MKLLSTFILTIICVTVMSSLSFAVRVTNLYQAQVAVSSQAIDEQNRAIVAALAEVMLKVSGPTPIIENAVIKQAMLNRARDLVLKISYPQAHLLAVEFDPAAVNQFCHTLKIPVWQQNRPLIVAWIVVSDLKHSSQMITSDTSDPLLALLKSQAERYGLPIIFPLMDLVDMNHITLQDVNSMAVDKLAAATQRYAGDIMLIGHVAQGTKDYVSTWTLLIEDKQLAWQFSNNTLTDTANYLIKQIAIALHDRFAINVWPEQVTQLKLTVNGMSQADDVEKLTAYLLHLLPVITLSIDQIAGDQVVLIIDIKSTPNDFAKLLSAENRLVPIDLKTWDYRWNH